MDTTTILGLAAVVLVVLGGVFLFATTRSRDRVSAVGALSRETRKRDRTKSASEPEEAVAETVFDRTAREDGVDLDGMGSIDDEFLTGVRRIIVVACGTGICRKTRPPGLSVATEKKKK